MGPAGIVLAIGGAISFAFGALTGLWLHASMMKDPEHKVPRYKMTLHKEALWSSFLCFAIAGWADEMPMPEAANVAVAWCVVLTGWFAMGQYFLVARANVQNAYKEAMPGGVGLFGKGALIVNLLAVGGLLLGTALFLVP
jgi:hypothetical protein